MVYANPTPYLSDSRMRVPYPYILFNAGYLLQTSGVRKACLPKDM